MTRETIQQPQIRPGGWLAPTVHFAGIETMNRNEATRWHKGTIPIKALIYFVPFVRRTLQAGRFGSFMEKPQ